MNDLAFLVVFVVVIVLLLFMAANFIRLNREQKKLKQIVQELTAQIQRSNDDVAGLCSAAVAVDRRLSVHEACLRDVQERIENQPAQAEFQPEYGQEIIDGVEKEDTQAYEKAIQRIRQGATIDELVKSFGLTRDEAVLLIRLHAGD